MRRSAKYEARLAVEKLLGVCASFMLAGNLTLQKEFCQCWLTLKNCLNCKSVPRKEKKKKKKKKKKKRRRREKEEEEENTVLFADIAEERTSVIVLKPRTTHCKLSQVHVYV